MAADGQRLDEGELFVGEFPRDVQLARGDEEARAQSAVAMDAERLMLFATVGVAAPAGVTLLTVNVRLDAATVAGRDVRNALADGEDFDAEFVAGDARVAEERHLAEVAADVGAADADLMDAHQRLAGAGRGGAGDVELLPDFGGFEG